MVSNRCLKVLLGRSDIFKGVEGVYIGVLWLSSLYINKDSMFINV